LYFDFHLLKEIICLKKLNELLLLNDLSTYQLINWLTCMQRDPQFYQTAPMAKDPKEAPLYRGGLLFDKKAGEYQLKLLEKFNKRLREDFPDLILKSGKIKRWPTKILIINVSADNLPTSHETKRVFDDYLKKHKKSIEVKVVNTQTEILQETSDAKNVLVFSQAVWDMAYDLKLAKKLIKKGVFIVPGETTAAGHIFSDKVKTFKMLQDNKDDYSRVARFVEINVGKKTIREVVDEIFEAMEELEKKFGLLNFFIKPKNSGGGLGGFQLLKTNNHYFLPDLSRVDAAQKEIKPFFVHFGPEHDDIVKELLWIYKIFARDPDARKSYIKTKLLVNLESTKAIEGELEMFKEYLRRTNPYRQMKMMSDWGETKAQIKKRLIRAIDKFENKFGKSYEPVVNEYLNYGRWIFRTHYRLTARGLELDTVYARLFQLAFYKQGVAYVGLDNIYNKQTHKLEPIRLQPINEIMVNALGGIDHLYECVRIGAEGMKRMIQLQTKDAQEINPFRAEVDMAPAVQRIGEINGDSVRELVLGSNFEDFIKKSQEWLEDGLRYFNFKT